MHVYIPLSESDFSLIDFLFVFYYDLCKKQRKKLLYIQYLIDKTSRHMIVYCVAKCERATDKCVFYSRKMVIFCSTLMFFTFRGQ